MKGLETAEGLATTLYDSYIKGRTWEEELNEMDEYASFTKEDVIHFANTFSKTIMLWLIRKRESMTGF